MNSFALLSSMPNFGAIGGVLVLVVLIVFLLLVIISNIKIVPQAHAYVVERLGEIGRAHV